MLSSLQETKIQNLHQRFLISSVEKKRKDFKTILPLALLGAVFDIVTEVIVGLLI